MCKYKICVYAISKNEEKFVQKWVSSMSEADYIVVADTGSTDNTVLLLTSLGVEVHSIHIEPWRFDIARNESLAFVPEDVDICVCTDFDELFEPGWREKIEEVWTDKTTRLRYSYTFGFHPDGTPIVTFLYEKIHKRKDFKWIYPVHEVLEYSGSGRDNYAIHQGIHLKHYPDVSKSRSNYLKLLELSAKDYPLYDRNIHYLGREYMFHEMYPQAIETLKYHLTLPTATWKEERCASMRFIANCYNMQNQTDEAINWLEKAILEAPAVRETYIAYAKIAYSKQDWLTLYQLVKDALSNTRRTGSYLDEESSWGDTLYDFGAIACFYLGRYEEALSFAKEALTYTPDDTRLQNNLKLIETAYKSKEE
ncbi:tetratricopeptide repeat-containing glycosyltransferase [Anaerosporobacter sp.]|uniref:tetratricopeptide repeat-containing glycosyltransferase n=1 Tax=Anaerosporobacter sp. TaxID=1872529 RepID=UPI00286F612A|nr:glycosyltransferase [Anaerosporobacter sp.]